MRDDIKWICSEQTSEEQIQKIEKKFGVVFPKDYKEFIREKAGAHPIPHTFDFNGHDEAVLDLIYSFNENKKTNILSMNSELSDNFIKGVIVFAGDPFGNDICFDFTQNPTKPPIVFCDNEIMVGDPNKLTFVAESFSEFIDKLYDPS